MAIAREERLAERPLAACWSCQRLADVREVPTAVSRQIFATTASSHQAANLALGATRSGLPAFRLHRSVSVGVCAFSTTHGPTAAGTVTALVVEPPCLQPARLGPRPRRQARRPPWRQAPLTLRDRALPQ
jgi:hypothetical protein